MDWMKLFFLVAAVYTSTTAEAAKKKIRIHLPQKVKHIHHHKKIYITNHPAPSQYAPAYLPSAEGAVAVQTNVDIPAVASIVPISSIEVFDESHSRLPGVTPAASKLLPLYRARGYYGPNNSDWDEKAFDLASSPETTYSSPDYSYLPTAFSAPGSGTASANYPPKRVKIVKVNETPRKKPRKIKTKGVVFRSKPHPEGEHPVSTFHEQFYSDLEGTSTIRKVKKPHRVEKIVDGNTEHIHTYSEEHIHKLIFDNRPKITGVMGVDPIGSASALTAAHPLIPVKNSQTVLAIQSDPFAGITAVGSMGTPSHLEYASYNPREVTHDHIFHDHGEIPADTDITKESLKILPQFSYDSHGLKINALSSKRHKNKSLQKHHKSVNPTSTNDFSYYENLYSPNSRLKKIQGSTFPTPNFDSSSEATVDDFRPIPSFRFNDPNNKGSSKIRNKSPNYHNSVKQTRYNTQANAPAPFSLSPTIIHDYKPKNYAETLSDSTGFSNFKDPFVNFKDDSYSNNFEYDTYASSSNIHMSENKKNVENKSNSKSKSQNIRFRNQDHQNIIDHIGDVSASAFSINDSSSDAGLLDNFGQPEFTETVQPIAYTIKKSSPVHQYYSAMALKALHKEQAPILETSKDNYQNKHAPNMLSATSDLVISTTPSSESISFKIQNVGVTNTKDQTKNDSRGRQTKTYSGSEVNSRQRDVLYPYLKSTESSTVRGKLKYGDKI